jgi:hypothetical protein
VFVFHVREESYFDAFQDWSAEKCIWKSENGLAGGRRKLHYQEPYNFHCSENILEVIKSRRISKQGRDEDCDINFVLNLKL